MKRGRKLGLREKALHLVCSKDSKGQSRLQNVHTGKVQEWQFGWKGVQEERTSAVSARKAHGCDADHLLL